MTGRFVTRKWRPTLAMIVFAVLATVAALPLAAAALLRLYETDLYGRFGAAPAIIGFSAVVLVTGIVGFVFLRTITHPVFALRDRMTSIANGDRGAIRPMSRCGAQELAELSESVLTMSDRLFQRSDYIATLAAHVSHEFKSPLTSIQGAAELLRESGATMTEAERTRFLDNIDADAARLATLVRRLREFALAETPAAGGSSDLAVVLAEIRRAHPGVRIQESGDLGTKIAMSAENAQIVLGHLVDNAQRHGARAVKISAAEIDGFLEIVVSDDGEEISAANRAKVFDAFFTTRRDSGGTGMGLTVVRSMLSAHGGSIELGPDSEKTTFRLRFPAVSRHG